MKKIPHCKKCDRDGHYKINCRNYPENQDSSKSNFHEFEGIKKPIDKKQLIAKLDKLFSKFIRLRDTPNNIFKCCSCGQIKDYKQADCGHFINRRWMATRWREDNCHAQCRSCNRFDEGNAVGYTMFMINRYGKEHVEYLESIKNTGWKPTEFELQVLIKEYKEKLKLFK